MSATPQETGGRRPYGEGIYRRELSVRMPGPGRVVGELVDDFHHFRAQLEHDGRCITRAHGAAVRHPWVTCAEAAAPLRRLEGMALAGAGSLRAAARHTSARAQCTHLFDAAALAIARLARGAGPVVYRIAVPDVVDERTRPQLWCDGELLLDWRVKGFEVEAPEPFTGQLLRGGGLAAWAEAELPPELAEPALLLQRSCTIARGRALDIEAFDRADRMAPRAMEGACHTYTPGVVERAWRMLGTRRELTDVDDIRAASVRPGS